MEDDLVRMNGIAKHFNDRVVLILVVVEDDLVPDDFMLKFHNDLVLILVVVEDDLVLRNSMSIDNLLVAS